MPRPKPVHIDITGYVDPKPVEIDVTGFVEWFTMRKPVLNVQRHQCWRHDRRRHQCWQRQLGIKVSDFVQWKVPDKEDPAVLHRVAVLNSHVVVVPERVLPLCLQRFYFRQLVLVNLRQPWAILELSEVDIFY